MQSNFHKDSQKIQNFKNNWVASRKFLDESLPLEKTIENLKSLEKTIILSNELVIVNDTREIRPLYVTSNVKDILGYAQEEFLSLDQSTYFKIGAIDQPQLFNDFLNWNVDFKKDNPHHNTKAQLRSYICGIQYRRKDGSIVPFLVRNMFLYGENFTTPPIDILHFINIAHLIKDNSYWIFFQTKDNEDVYSKFYSKEGVHNYPFTNREKQILRLIAKGLRSKEVAAQLFISPETVSQHRKNMIKRTNTQSTAALIQLSKMCEFI